MAAASARIQGIKHRHHASSTDIIDRHHQARQQQHQARLDNITDRHHSMSRHRKDCATHLVVACRSAQHGLHAAHVSMCASPSHDWLGRYRSRPKLPSAFHPSPGAVPSPRKTRRSRELHIRRRQRCQHNAGGGRTSVKLMHIVNSSWECATEPRTTPRNLERNASM